MSEVVTRTIRYTGSSVRVGALVQMLERQGLTVEWSPPQERRGLGDDGLAVGLGILASGSYDLIKAAVKQFLDRFPRAEIVIEDVDAAPDDGGFLDG